MDRRRRLPTRWSWATINNSLKHTPCAWASVCASVRGCVACCVRAWRATSQPGHLCVFCFFFNTFPQRAARRWIFYTGSWPCWAPAAVSTVNTPVFSSGSGFRTRWNVKSPGSLALSGTLSSGVKSIYKLRTLIGAWQSASTTSTHPQTNLSGTTLNCLKGYLANQTAATWLLVASRGRRECFQNNCWSMTITTENVRQYWENIQRRSSCVEVKGLRSGCSSRMFW